DIPPDADRLPFRIRWADSTSTAPDRFLQIREIRRQRDVSTIQRLYFPEHPTDEERAFSATSAYVARFYPQGSTPPQRSQAAPTPRTTSTLAPEAESSIQAAMHAELRAVRGERDRLRCELVDSRAEVADYRESNSATTGPHGRPTSTGYLPILGAHPVSTSARFHTGFGYGLHGRRHPNVGGPLSEVHQPVPVLRRNASHPVGVKHEEMARGQKFEEYPAKWRAQAVKHIPPISEAQQIQLFHSTLRGVYYSHLLAHTSSFSDLIEAGKKLDLGIKLGRMEDPTSKGDESSKKVPTTSSSSSGRRGKEVTVNTVNTTQQGRSFCATITFPAPALGHADKESIALSKLKCTSTGGDLAFAPPAMKLLRPAGATISTASPYAM
ncbi:hypothetical protein CRG98_029014, partial [Punica granatum]